MILIDFSSILYQSLYSSIKASDPKKMLEKYVTTDFIRVTIDFILESIFKIGEKSYSTPINSIAKLIVISLTLIFRRYSSIPMSF